LPLTASNSSATLARAKVGNYFRDVIDNHKLPAVPIVAGKVLQMIQDSNWNVEKLCRLLSDDAALSGRVLAVSRSPIFALRNPPNNLAAAVKALGLRALNTIVLANATHSLCLKGNKTSERLWNHSLAVALAMRLLAKRGGYRDGDMAFLAGLMHDVRQMIFVIGDPQGFAMICEELLQGGGQMVDKEREAYDMDHTLIGMRLLEEWNLDHKIPQAALNHHSDVGEDGNNELAGLIAVAEYVCGKAELGFFAVAPVPPPAALTRWQLDGRKNCQDGGGCRQSFQRRKRAFQAGVTLTAQLPRILVKPAPSGAPD